MKRLFIKSVLATVALAACGLASAQDIKERTIKFGLNSPEGHPAVAGMRKFASAVEAKSGGKIKVQLFLNGSLGSDQATLSALKGGTVEMAVMNSGILASEVKALEIFDFPFLFANEKEADAIVDGPIGQKMHAALADRGIVGLSYWELGFRNITTGKKVITKVDDIAGLKLRVIPNAINVDWVSALGANPTPLAFPEVYAAMEQKAIDGHENPFSVINANKFYEVQKHLAVTNHQYNPQAVIVSKKLWDSLSADEKKIFDEAAVEATKFQRQFNREQMGVALDNLKKNGMQVTEFNAAEMAKFRDKMKPVIDKHSAIVGPDVVNALQAELGKLRGGK